MDSVAVAGAKPATGTSGRPVEALAVQRASASEYVPVAFALSPTFAPRS